MSELHTIARGDRSRIASPRQAVVRTDAEWRALWAAHAGPDDAAPEVDLQARTIAAVFAGERPTAGYGISIVGVRRDGAGAALLVEERQPPAGALTAQVITTPFHIVSLPRDEAELEFADGGGPRIGRVTPSAVARSPRHEATASSTGLTPTTAAVLAYVAGPLSGALLLAAEGSSRFVRFHAWQALVGLGLLALAAACFLVLAFVTLVISPTAFWGVLWLSAGIAAAWLVAWAACMVQAYRGRLWKLPLAGAYAERRAFGR